MHDYRRIKRELGRHVSQTIDSPIMIGDIWELTEAFLAVFCVLLFGVIAYEWGLMCFSLFLVLVVVPIVKKNSYRGVFLHWPYRKLQMRLPGLLNPRGRRKYSD